MNNSTTDKWEALKKLAEEASKWSWCPTACSAYAKHAVNNVDLDVICEIHPDGLCEIWGKYDGEYIAAANPAAILELLSELSRKEEENQKLRQRITELGLEKETRDMQLRKQLKREQEVVRAEKILGE